MFLYKKRAGHFLESEKVFDNYYGTPKKSVNDVLRSGKNVLLCIDVKGARTVSRKISKAIKIFVKVPSLKILEKRLKGRGSETAKNLRLRLKVAKEELKEAKDYHHVIINDNLGRSFFKLEHLIISLVDGKD